MPRYLLAHVAALSLLAWALHRWGGPLPEHRLSARSLLFLPLAFLCGIQIPVFMHNCTHANFRSRLVNNVLGELSSLFILMGLDIVRINHSLHHAFADTQRDPHDPTGKSFFAFIFTAQVMGVRVIRDCYLSFHGDTAWNRGLFNASIVLQYLGHALRLTVWYLFFGPGLFIAFYLPSFLTFSLAFAHVNYITHRKNAAGEVEVLNKNDNAYYRFVNFIGSGVYFHKNHHRRPRLLNPMALEKSQVRA